jgi:DNA-binding IscR family transcriptional regulator
MAKTPKSLKQRIDDLANAMGGSQKPAYADVRSQLFDFSAAAEELQNGASIREAEEKIARLEEANEALKAEKEEFNAEKEYLKVQLLEAKYEIDRFREEEKEREKKEQEIDPKQFQILQLLASESECKWLKIAEIARSMKFPIDEAEVYINGLENLGLVIFHPHEPGGGGWHRTAEGNKWVVAKRWGDEEEQPNANKDLGETAQKVLILIAREDGLDETAISERIGIRLSVIRRVLRLLREADMATDAEEPGEAFTSSEGPVGPTWRLLIKGEDYLAERSSL